MIAKPRVHLIRRINPSGKRCYTVRWLRDGKYHSRACGSDKERAQELKRQKKKALVEGFDDEVRLVSWDAFADEHTAKLPGECNASSVRATLRQFAEMFKPKGPHAVTFSMVEDYQRRLRGSVSPWTLNRKLRELHHSFAMAVERGYIRKNPMGNRFPYESVEETDPVQIPDEWKQKLLDACPNLVWRTFLFLLMTTGCRRGEVLGLVWDRVNLDNGYIRLTKTKGKRVRLQPLVDNAVELLHQMYDEAPKMVSGGGETAKEPCPFRELKWNTCREFDKVRNRAGLPKCRMKDLRSTAGTDAADCEFNAFHVQSFLGHSNPQVTAKHYVKRKLDSKRRIAEALAARLKIA